MMGKMDKIKEDVGAIKSYLGFIVAIMVALGAGIAKLYLDNTINVLFYSGFFMMLVLAFVFAYLSKQMHKKIKDLEDL
jgi:small basic protein